MTSPNGTKDHARQKPEGATPRGIVLFTEGPVRYHIRRMAVPMLWGMLATVCAALADIWFLARLGTTHLAAITFTFPVVMLFMNLTLGLASGFSSLLARALGEGTMARVQQLTVSAMLLSAALVFVLSILGYFTINPLFTALGAGPATLPLIRDYMSIWYIAMIFVVVPLTGNFALRATGNPKAASFVMISSAMVNIVLDPMFIFGFWFIPEMGIKGAALAGVCSRVAAFIATFYMLGYKNRLVTFNIPPLHTMIKAWKEILRIGGPLAMTNMVMPLSTALVTFLLAQYGEVVVAGFGVASRIEGLAVIPFIAVASSMSPIAGQNYGASMLDRVVDAIKQGFVFVTVYGLLCAAVMALFHKSLPFVFDPNPEVVRIAGLFLLVVPIGYVGMGIAMVVGASYTGMGNPRPSIIMSLSRLAIVYLPLALLGGWLFGPVGIFAAGAMANLLVALGALVFVGLQARRAVLAGQIGKQSVRFLFRAPVDGPPGSSET